MAKKIKGSDIIEKDHLSNAITQAKELLKVYTELGAQVKKNAQNIKKSVQSADPNTAKGVRDLNKALIESEVTKKANLKIDKQRENLEIKLKQLTTAKAKQNAILNEQAKRLAKSNRDQAKAVLDTGNAYEKLKRDTNKAQMEFKKLAAQFGVNSKQAQAAQRKFDKLDNELQQINKHARDGRRDVGRYSAAIKGTVGSLKNMAGALGVVGGIQLFSRVVKDAFNITKNFDQSQADLASVLGVSRDEMTALTLQAKELGATTKFTASQVAELQLEYAKLGFTQQQIEGMTESTLQLAAAAGTELGNAASITGATMRGFGLDVSETQRVVDVMAKSFSASSLDIEKFKVGMAAVAPAAKTAGFTIEETTALLGTLTNAGIDASTAGTGLRNMMLEATKKGITFQEALDQIANATDQNAAALNLFGKRGATLGVILANNQEAADDLTKSLENSAGAAGEMADKQLDTLGGALDLLRSAWEGYILGADGASGASEKLKNIIKFLADNLDTILNTVVTAAKLFGTYKLAMGAATVANNLFGGSLAKMKQKMGALALAITLGIKIFEGFKQQWEEANYLSNKFGEIQDEVTGKLIKEQVQLFKLRDELLKTNVASEERQVVIDKINDQYGTTLQNLEDEVAFMDQLAIAYEKYVKQLEKKIQMQVLEKELVDVTEAILNINQALADEDTADISKGIMRKQKEDLLALKKQLEQALFALGQMNEEIKTNTEVTEENVETTKKVTKKANKEKENEQKKAWEKRKDIEKMGFGEMKKIHQEFNTAISEDIPLVTQGFLTTFDAVIEKEREAAEKTLDEYKKFSDQMAKFLESFFQNQIQSIESSIERLNSEIEDSQGSIDSLREDARLGNTDAAEAIKAERIAQARDKAEIERLEKKKKNLLIAISTLNLANNLFQQGDLDGFAKAQNKARNFLDKLPTFFDGTEGTVAQALGATGTRDGHHVRVHDNEHIIGSKDSDKLHRAGLYKNKDIVNNALAYNDLMAGKALKRQGTNQFTDKNIIRELKETTKAVKDFKVVQQHFDFKELVEIIKDGNTVTKNHYNYTKLEA